MKKPLPLQLLKKPFLAREALSYGVSRSFLTRLVKSGVLCRLSRGVYKASGVEEITNEDLYRVATLRCGMPSAICLLSALEYYHVTDQIPKQVWMMVPESKRILSKDMKLIRTRNPQWATGVRKARYYWITTLERTLIDGLLHKQLMGSQIALEAIKQAVLLKKVKLGDLYDVAKKMHVEHRIHTYIEVLSS